MKPMKVRYTNLIIDKIIPLETYLEYYICLPKAVSILVNFRKIGNLLLGMTIISLLLYLGMQCSSYTKLRSSIESNLK
jgi:hypothetical protein